MTSVVNKRKEKYDVYIGRKDIGMHYGNPFSHLNAKGTTKVKSRDEAILCFQLWIDGTGFQDVEPERRQWILDNLKELKGKVLGCYCHPLSCHGEIYIKMLDI